VVKYPRRKRIYVMFTKLTQLMLQLREVLEVINNFINLEEA